MRLIFPNFKYNYSLKFQAFALGSASTLNQQPIWAFLHTFLMEDIYLRAVAHALLLKKETVCFSFPVSEFSAPDLWNPIHCLKNRHCKNVKSQIMLS
jgi:hypothetical protein